VKIPWLRFVQLLDEELHPIRCRTIDSIPGCCRTRLKVYRPNYRFGHLPHTDACDLVRSVDTPT